MANPLQYSCLENSMDRGAWRVTVHDGATNSCSSETFIKRAKKWTLRPKGHHEPFPPVHPAGVS